MRRRLGIAVSALLLAAQFGSALQAATPTLEELGAIAELLDANDVKGLRAFLLLHPEFLEGDSTLAALLRDFMVQSSDIAGFLGVSPDLAVSLFGSDDSEGDLVTRDQPEPLPAPPEPAEPAEGPSPAGPGEEELPPPVPAESPPAGPAEPPELY